MLYISSIIRTQKSKMAGKKLALMSCKRGPRNALLSWIYNESRKQGDQQQHIKISLSNTLIAIDSLHFETDQLNDWMSEVKLEEKKMGKSNRNSSEPST